MPSPRASRTAANGRAIPGDADDSDSDGPVWKRPQSALNAGQRVRRRILGPMDDRPYPRPQRVKRSPLRLSLMAVGIAAILTGVGLVAVPLIGVWQRGHADQTALGAWQKGGSNALAGAPAASTPAPKTAVTCGSGSPSDYALVTFSSPAAEHYGGVATDGTWDSLHNRSMVHYTGTPAPGQQGNSIIAFHREPDYEHIDQLKRR